MSCQKQRVSVGATVVVCVASVLIGRIALGATVPSLSDASLRRTALSLADGERLRIERVLLAPDSPPVELELERFRVFAPDARIVVHGDAGNVVVPPPAHAWLRGTVAGRASSRVVLTVLEDGGLRGLVADGGRYWLAVQGPGEATPIVQEVTSHPALADGARRFDCGADRLPRRAPEVAVGPSVLGRVDEGPAMRQAPAYTVRVGVETDYEYYQLFGSIAGALSYAGDLFAHASTYYTAEVGTDFWISHVSLWTTPADPWTQTSSACGLFEFGRYWSTNMQGVTRTIGHFLSGKTAGGGMSWTGVLCSPAFSYDISGWGCSLSPAIDLYGGGYGFSGDITGSFQISNPSVVWDIYVVSHEAGHNFNTGHTHCYVPPVDQCWGSELPSPPCYSGPASLPCSTPGAGCGTIMSYCHTIAPGMANISLTLGLADPWGFQSWRVPGAMSAYVASTAATYPTCLASIVFADGFECGGCAAWSSTVP